MKRLFLVLFCLTLCSCSGPGLTETTILGRWIEEKDNLKLEFTANHLYAKRKPNAQVEVGLWSVEGEELVMRSLTGPEVTRWTPQMDEDGFIIDKGQAQFRVFQKLKTSGTAVDDKLVGLWRSYGDHPQFVEFTDKGTFVAVFRRLDKPGGDPYNVGCLADVVTAGQSKFYLEGYMGAKRMIRGVNPHPYRIDGEKLVWKGKHKTQKAITYRKVTAFDLEEFAAQGTPGATPSPTP